MVEDRDAHRFRADELGKDFRDRRRPEWLDRLLAEQEPPPEVDGLPVLRPGTYSRVGCRCGSCEVCRWFARLEGEENARPWAKRHAIHDPGRPRFENAVAALVEYVELREAGYPVGSVSRTIDHVGQHGVRIQSSGGSPDSPASLAAETVATVERCLVEAYDRRNARMLDEGEAVQVLLARKVGRVEAMRGRDGRQHHRRVAVPAVELAQRYDVTSRAIAGVVKSGMRRLRIEMAARGLTRWPRPTAGLHEAIDRRQRELAEVRYG